MDMGESCSPNRVARLAQLAGIRAQIGYKRRPEQYGCKPSLAVDNTLGRRFDVEAPDRAWVTDITYIRTQEGFSYLAVVLDLFSRRIVGWSIQARQTTNVVLQALLAAVWRRKPKGRVLVHSDQGSQFTSMEWASFLKHHGLEPSMSRRGNCHDNAVAESFFNLLKRERIRRKIYRTRDEARADVFDYFEMFYNRPASTHETGCCRPSSSNGSTKRKQRASRKLGAVQGDVQMGVSPSRRSAPVKRFLTLGLTPEDARRVGRLASPLRFDTQPKRTSENSYNIND